MGGRFVWASASDWIGRKNTYFIFFVLGAVLYFLVPSFAASGQMALFVLAYCIILTMYGGGFATVPAYLARHVRHGVCRRHSWTPADRVDAAGVCGSGARRTTSARTKSRTAWQADAYTMTVHIMAVLLVVGFICNLLVNVWATSIA